MEYRYSYDKEGPAPNGICGGHVFEQMVKGQMTIADRTPPH